MSCSPLRLWRRRRAVRRAEQSRASVCEPQIPKGRLRVARCVIAGRVCLCSSSRALTGARERPQLKPGAAAAAAAVPSPEHRRFGATAHAHRRSPATNLLLRWPSARLRCLSASQPPRLFLPARPDPKGGKQRPSASFLSLASQAEPITRKTMQLWIRRPAVVVVGRCLLGSLGEHGRNSASVVALAVQYPCK